MNKRIIGNPATTPMAMPDLSNKVDKEDGKGLSTNDFTDADKQTLTDIRSDMNIMIGEIGDVKESLDTKVDKSIITNNFDDVWEDDGTLIPTASVLSKFVPDDLVARSVDDIWDEYTQIPSVETTMELINPTPITEIPETLEPNKAYNFGFVDNLSLSFPTYAQDGDVIYINFFAEADEGKLPNLIIDTTNTTDIELIPENSTGYEIFAKYNGNASKFGIDNYWIVNYSEFTL